MASEDAYLELVEKYDPLLVEKEALENDIEALRSSVEELIVEIDHQLFIGFEIICDAVKAITPDFDFKKLDEIPISEA